MEKIYFDNSATTPLCPAAREKILSALDVYGNPSSLHALGFEAEKMLTEAREKVASSLGKSAEEIVFTSCGSEANCLAIFGAAEAGKRRGSRIVTTDSEHPSVTEPMKLLEKQGFEVIYLKTVGGRIDPDEFENALNDKVILVSIMHTNNETGAVYGVDGLIPTIRNRAPAALIHCDMVQGYMKTAKIPAADLITVSAHKIHAPKGIAALYIRKGVRVIPRLLGGGQENGMRSGTENTVFAAAFGAAAGYMAAHLRENIEKTSALREYIVKKISGVGGCVINAPEKPCCSIISAAFPGFKSEVLLHSLSEQGVYVSSGSACSSRKGKSRVLTAFGAEKYADSTLRISISPFNTEEEADALAAALENSCAKLKKVRGNV